MITEVRAADPPAGGVAAWWLGQAGWIFKGRSGTVVLDAFLSPELYERYKCIYAPPFRAEDCDCADFVLGTHIHADHIDPAGFAGMLAASTQAQGVVPAAVRDRVLELDAPADRLLGAVADVPLERNGVRIMPQPAVHADNPDDGYGFHVDAGGRHPFLGYTIQMDGVRICHVGDTLIYEGLAERLRDLDLDLLLLPINGVSRFRELRGLVGNLNTFEAAELAELSGARLTVPMHHDLFTDNSEDALHFADYAARRHPAARIYLPNRCERFDVMPGSPGNA